MYNLTLLKVLDEALGGVASNNLLAIEEVEHVPIGENIEETGDRMQSKTGMVWK